ncbi:MAG: hybrid sensor histidine kinase/response regulator [Leptolyngbya sp. SIO1D8]|nr:hybrid sensor histidine kinase/response regulator [Leptolyngbya sp. SIO1D8]
MSDAKELEIKQQFLDEAQEYLGDLEAALLGIASGQVDTEKVNAALRSAHSIKGGAGMMGYEVLNQFAHKLEDALKVLKIQKQQLEMDAELERLMLSAVDCLGQVIVWNRQQVLVDQRWFEDQAQPIFEQLYQRLGEPQEEDAASMLSSEEGQNILPILFETEVEGCLNRLEAILADPQQPCLNEEVTILAQELEGLGEMLQLPAFIALCQSVIQQLQITPEQHVTISQQAIAAWRRSQALVMTGQLDQLPTAIGEEEILPVASVSNFMEGDVADWAMADSPETPISDVAIDDFSIPTEIITDERFVMATAPPPPPRSVQPPDIASNHVTPEPEEPDTTVRVSVKRLNALNDLMGELTTERGGLTLKVGRLRGLIDKLKQRVQTLESANSELRSTYDQVAMGMGQPTKEPLLLMPATDTRTWQTAAANQPISSFDDTFDALEMDRYSDLHLLSQEMMEAIVQIQEVTSDIELELEETEQTGRNLNKTGKQLQKGLTQVRMRPLSDVLERFPRALRELCLQHGKEAELKVSGGKTLVDRNILESLSDPLMHLLRNAFDHGLEDPDTRIANGKPRQGCITIRATHRNNRIVITVIDDGHGIPLDKIRYRAEQMGLDAELLASASEEELLSLIFEPGFSTSTEVTDLSGRGVGMDVVRNNLKQVHGEITVNTELGRGTTFTLSVPLTLSVTRILLAESQNMALAIPTDALEEILVLPPAEVMSAAQEQVFKWGDRVIPLVQLSKWFAFNGPRPTYKLETPPAIDTLTVLVVNHGGHYVGLQVDRCWGEQEVAIRQIEGGLPLPPGFSNCTILGDGRVVPLVSISEMLHWITSNQRSAAVESKTQLAHNLSYQITDSTHQQSRLLSFSSTPARPTMLIVDDSINVRRFLALTLEKAGYRVEQARDGQDALDQLQQGLQPHAIICDIEMPRLDGYGFLTKAKAEAALAPIPVVMLTSRSGQKHRQLAMNLGATAYFSKPYNEHVLLQTLEQLVGVAA